MKVLIGICAAGNSQRMGFDKLSTPPTLHSPDTLLSRAATAAHGQRFIVALPSEDHPYFLNRKAQLRPHDEYLVVENAAEGLSHTLKALARHAQDQACDGLAILMADMPFITGTHVESIIDLFKTFQGSRIVRAQCESGREGYPVVFPRTMFADFETLTGDQGIGVLSERYGVKRLEMPSEAPCMHVNTPEDWHQM